MREDLKMGMYGAVGAFVASLAVLLAVDRYLRRPFTRYQLRST